MNLPTLTATTCLILLVVTSLSDTCQGDALDGYRQTLRQFDVQPTPAGAVDYLRYLHPTPQRKQQIAALIDQLADASFAQREAAMQQLLRMPDLPIAQLNAAVAGNDPEVSWRAREILKQSTGQSSQVILAALKVIAGDAKGKPVDNAVPVLLATLPLCSQSHLQVAAIEALRVVATEQDIPALRTALAGSDSAQRVAAASTLCAVTTADDRTSLHPLLNDRDDRVALEVARNLADVGDRKSLPALVRLLNADDNSIRSDAVVTLRGVTGQYMNFASYESADERYAAAKKWNTWVTNEGANAKLTFPVPRNSGARGDLGGQTLVATGSKSQVILFDSAGKQVWIYAAASWSAEKLRGGNILIAMFNANKVIELDPRTQKVVWEFPNVNAMTAKPLANGNIVVADFNGNRVVEINRNKEIVWKHGTGSNCFDCDRLPNGNTIFGCPNYVREVTPEGETVREWKIEGRLNGFQALPNGNILVANFGQGEVVELTPDGQRVWEFAEPSPCDVFRLPTGNMLISTQKRIIEISPDKKLIREICPAQYGSARM